ncbi:MAG TPA: FAD-dependent oxidoreductase [Acidimicrobiales bacterium]|nr:FAD-dependent oxidoreductase [Acidimicrobiales bacterium]
MAVVGASTAGLAAAGALRRHGFDGRLSIIGDEPHRPYDRPPLIKQFLAGEWDADRLALPGADAPDLDADWRLGVAATGFDAATRTVRLADGEELTSDGVVLTCGATPRSLPGTQGLAGIHTIRTLDDATALRDEVTRTTGPVVVVGAGFVGAEVAATCRTLGRDVVLVEPLAVPLARVLGLEIGAVFADLHRDHGVDLRLGTGVERVAGDGNGRVARVQLADGTAIDSATVVVGIGVRPSTDWLAGSGLTIDDGIVCDASCTAAPGVVAAGDVARWPNQVFDDDVGRIEHWDHAFAQAEHAAESLLAGDAAEPFATVPWFWSDQYDRKIQLAGRVRPDDDVVVVDGSLAERRFVALYGRAGRLVGVLGMNRPRHVVQLRPRIAERITLDEALALFA